MSKRGVEWYVRPELIFADLVGKAAREETLGKHYQRATVLAVDLDGGRLENKLGEGSLKFVGRDGKTREFAATVGANNPRYSIKARILTDGTDRLLDDDDLRIFWPMFPQDQIGTPISPGEHVYVVFEGPNHGLWLSRVSGHDSANSFHGVDSYTEPSSPHSAMDFFEPNEPQYNRTDDAAGLAQPLNPTSLFDKD
jgi:hypothetical protein